MANTPYGHDFFAQQRDDSLSSARAVVPYVLELSGAKSVADFGSGIGAWLSVFHELGVEDIIGLDGDYVRDDELAIPADRFIRSDLSSPIDLRRRFDLVVSVEVAEHLPLESASIFVESLTRHSGLVLFSAAVPGQRGTSHRNEQWPEYWEKLFREIGYECIDCLRDVFWRDERVCWWYRQNMFLFVSRDLLSCFPRLLKEQARPKRMPLALVHPGCLDNITNDPILPREELMKIPGTLRAAITRRAKTSFR